MIKTPLQKIKTDTKDLMSDVIFLNILIDYTLEKECIMQKRNEPFYRFKKLNY
jgi:hypothetical protein